MLSRVISRPAGRVGTLTAITTTQAARRCHGRRDGTAAGAGDRQALIVPARGRHDGPLPQRSARRWLAVAAAACAVAGAAAASSSPLTLASLDLRRMSLEELSEIQITSVSRRAEPLSQAPQAVFVITAEDIRRSGATSLPEALRLAPNLHVARASAHGYAISARGFNSPSANKLQVLIDGRSVYTPLFSGVFWDVQEVMLEDVERIEVISGPGGTLWGVNAVNGLINVITRNAAETHGTLLTGGIGNQDLLLAARHGGELAGGTHYRLYARQTGRAHTETAAGDKVDDALRHTQVGFRTDWSDASDSISLRGAAYRGRHGQPLPGTIHISGMNFALGDIEVAGGHLSARWQRHLPGDSRVTVLATIDHTERTVPPTFSEVLDLLDLQAQHTSHPMPGHTLVWGAQYRHGWDRVTNSPYVAFLPGHVRQRWVSLFAQDEIELTPDLRLTLGARLEDNDYTGGEFLPNVRLAWKPADSQLLWAAASHTVRAPSRLDHDTYVPGAPPFLLRGGEAVRGETADVLELGYRGQPTPATSLAVTVFHARYDHLRTQEIDPGGTFVVYANGMKGHTEGLEAWGSWQVSPDWRLSGAFSWLGQRFRLKAGSNDVAAVPTLEGANPERRWSLRSSHRLRDNAEFDLMLRHVSALSVPEVPSYWALDMRYAWRPEPGVEFAVAGRNLFAAGHGEFTALATRSHLQPGVFLSARCEF